MPFFGLNFVGLASDGILRFGASGVTQHSPAKPTLTAGTLTNSGATLTGSAFSDPDVGDTHAASQWQVATAADAGFVAPVISTGDDAVNKTSYAATGLSASTDYIARARYKDSTGRYSVWSDAAPFTTSAGGAFAPYDLQLNFRNSSDGSNGGVVIVDGAGQDYVLTTDAYTGSALRGTKVWGYTARTGIDGRDRQASSVVPPQLCGLHFADGINDLTFRIDLPAPGTYDVHVAIGDGANDVTVSKLTVKDGSTALFGGVDWGNTLALHYKDATGADRYFNNTGAGGGIGWVETNVPVSCTFAGTVMNVVIDKASRITALRVVRTA